MEQSQTYIAFRSAKRMGILLGILVVLGLPMLLVDFSFLVPEGDMSFRNELRRSGLARLIEFLPWVGGGALIGALAALPMCLKKRVEIEISSDGIAYPPALQETLPWDRVERVAIRKMAFTRVVSVFIRDAQSFPIKPMARKVAELNKSAGDLGDINIETLRSDANFDELVEALSTYVEVKS